MRVLLFAPNYLPATRYGGPVRSIHGLARSLVELGHDVSVLTTDVDGPTRLAVPLDRPIELDGVRVYFSPIKTPRRLYYSPDLARLAHSLVPDMDVVHVNGMFLWPGPYLSRAARKAGKILIISPRGMLMPEMIAGKSRLLKNGWIRLQERSNLAAAHAIHVTSDTEAEGLRQTGLDLAQVTVIGNGVDAPEHTLRPSDIEEVWGEIPPGQRVAFLGRLDWTKGLDLAIEAVRQHPNAMLLIAGHDQIALRSRLEARLKRENGSYCGTFLGPLDGSEKWAFLAGADVLLVPSVRESFSNSAAEALVMGTPVIATESVGAADLLRRLDPSLVVPREQPALDVALAALLADKDRRVRIGKAGRDLAAAELTWTSIAERIGLLYRGKTD